MQDPTFLVGQLEAYKGTENLLLNKLVADYGPEPRPKPKKRKVLCRCARCLAGLSDAQSHHHPSRRPVTPPRHTPRPCSGSRSGSPSLPLLDLQSKKSNKSAKKNGASMPQSPVANGQEPQQQPQRQDPAAAATTVTSAGATPAAGMGTPATSVTTRLSTAAAQPIAEAAAAVGMDAAPGDGSTEPGVVVM